MKVLSIGFVTSSVTSLIAKGRHPTFSLSLLPDLPEPTGILLLISIEYHAVCTLGINSDSHKIIILY